MMNKYNKNIKGMKKAICSTELPKNIIGHGNIEGSQVSSKKYLKLKK